MRKYRATALVIQLGRLSETVQTLMALRAAKQLYPDLEVTLVVRAQFAQAAKRVPWIKRVVELPAGDWTTAIKGGALTQEAVIPQVRAWVTDLQRPSDSAAWDYLVNWTFSESSSFLASMIPAQVKLGYVRGDQPGVYCADGWSCFVQGIVQGGVGQNIHLTDVFTTQLLTALQIHLGMSEEDGGTSVSSKGFFSLHVQDSDTPWAWRDTSKTWIAVQLGGTDEKRKLSPVMLGQVVVRLLRDRPECGIVLLGEFADLESERQILSMVDPAGTDAKRVVSLVGKSSFDLWVSVIARCQWLISGLNSAVQIASVVGTRSLCIVTQSSRWYENGPYGNGHYVIETDAPDSLDAEAIARVWEYASHEWSHQRARTLKDALLDEGIRHERIHGEVYRSRIRGSVDGGGVYFEPVLHPGLTFERWTRDVMGQVARSWYCGWTAPPAQDYPREWLNPDFLQRLRALEEPVSVLIRVCQKAERLAQSLAERTARLRSDRVMTLQDREEVSELGGKLRELDTLIQRLGMVQPPILAFAHMSRVLMHNLRGENLHGLSKETALSYRQLLDGAKVLESWLQATLNLAKPIMIRPDNLVSLAEVRSQMRKEVSP